MAGRRPSWAGAAAQRPGDPLDTGGLAATWSKTTRGMVENGYDAGSPGSALREFLAPDQMLTTSRVTADRMRAYTAALAVIDELSPS